MIKPVGLIRARFGTRPPRATSRGRLNGRENPATFSNKEIKKIDRARTLLGFADVTFLLAVGHRVRNTVKFQRERPK